MMRVENSWQRAKTMLLLERVVHALCRVDGQEVTYDISGEHPFIPTAIRGPARKPCEGIIGICPSVPPKNMQRVSIWRSSSMTELTFSL